jgi:Domain of unknown function (DUF4129)
MQRAVERRLREFATPGPGGSSSWGERLLPLFYAAMETCWLGAIFIGLASINLFLTRELLMPLWAPFVIIVVSYWLALRAEYGASHTVGSVDEATTTSNEAPGISLLVAFTIIIALFLVWQRFYAQANFLLDPRWLLALLNDILFLNLRAWQALFMTALAFYLCWRGVRLSRRSIEPSDINSALCLGLGIILAVILVRAGQESAGVVLHDETMLLLLVPIFLVLALCAHALARVTFVRRLHPVGLEGSPLLQERAVLLIIASIGLVLLVITLIVGSVTSPAVLADTQHALAPLGAAYDWLVAVIVQLAIFVLTPVAWLVTWFFSLFHPKPLPPPAPPKGNQHNPLYKPNPVPPEALLAFVTALKFILPIVFIVAIFFLMRWALRRRRASIVTTRKEDDLRESVWSWQLFWAQFKLFLRALFGRFLLQRKPKTEEQSPQEEIKGEPAARSIREIYRALLKKAATRGYPREKDETPYEFERRLNEKVPTIQPQLAEITAVYAATRYGDVVPEEAELARVRGMWSELEKNWV